MITINKCDDMNVFNDIITLKEQNKQLESRIELLQSQLQQLQANMEQQQQYTNSLKKKSIFRRIVAFIPIAIPIKIVWKLAKYAVHMVL